MARQGQRIRIPILETKFVQQRNLAGNWLVDRFNRHIAQLNKVADSLPRKLPWRQRTAEEFKVQAVRLMEAGDGFAAYRLLWEDLLDQVQAFGLLSAWRLIELVSSGVWAIRRDDPLCAAILARAALETSAAYAWFQLTIRPGIDAVIGKEKVFVDAKPLEEALLKTLWASRLEDAEKFYNPTNIITVIDHITSKVPDQEDVGPCYKILCEIAHPNMLGRSLYLSTTDGMATMSRDRGPSATIIEYNTLLAFSWAAAALTHSLPLMQETCVKMLQDVQRYRDGAPTHGNSWPETL